MRQVHNINESYRSYHRRKYGLPNTLIWTGIFIFAFGMGVFNFVKNINVDREFLIVGQGMIILGIILFLLGIKSRLSRKNRDFSP